MKYAVAIAPENALPSAFVVFQGFRQNIPLAAELGYKGVELALKSAEYGFALTDTHPVRMERLMQIFFGLIDLASSYGQKINLGRVRGNLDGEDQEKSWKAFSDSMHKVCGYATSKGVDLLLEPVNRYELNFINNLEDGHKLLKSLEISNLWLPAGAIRILKSSSTCFTI